MTNQFDDIPLKVIDFRAKQSLSTIEPINCKSLLLKLNTFTFYRPLSDTFSGMCLKKDNLTFILVNSTHPRGKQHFTIAHELYHLFYQPDFKPHICNPGKTTGVDINEKLADAFAAELLMPSLGLIQMIPPEEKEKKSITVSTILKLENYFSVSHAALLIRLKSLKLISSSQFDYLSNLKIKQTAKEYGFGLSLYEPGNENVVLGDYGIKAKNLFTERKISENHYYELMNFIGIDPTSAIDE
jgi:Zn-dependent peptidase ImmA (M78 family)